MGKPHLLPRNTDAGSTANPAEPVPWSLVSITGPFQSPQAKCCYVERVTADHRGLYCLRTPRHEIRAIYGGKEHRWHLCDAHLRLVAVDGDTIVHWQEPAKPTESK